MIKFNGRILIPIVLILLLGSCQSAQQASQKQSRKQTYVDANLMFEISYPEEWAHSREPVTLMPLARQTTTWRVDRKEDQEFNIELSIISLPIELNTEGYLGLEKILTKQNGDLTILERESVTITAGTARKLEGQTPRASYEIWLFLGAQRHYIISCSSTASGYERQKTQFHEIVESFKPLE